MIIKNHYQYLEEHFQKFTEDVGLKGGFRGLIVAHGDKCYGYKSKWEKAGIPFEKGVAIYLLTYVSPFSREVRETHCGWVDPSDWIIAQKDRFLALLPD